LNRTAELKKKQEHILEEAREIKKEKALHHLRHRIHGRD
jgi:hypothetical protein